MVIAGMQRICQVKLVKLLHLQEVCQVEQLILACKFYASMIAIMWHEVCICKVCAKATPLGPFGMILYYIYPTTKISGYTTLIHFVSSQQKFYPYSNLIHYPNISPMKTYVVIFSYYIQTKR
jgi:hypothetical protein